VKIGEAMNILDWLDQTTVLPTYDVTPEKLLDEFRFYSNHPKWHPKNFPQLRELAQQNQDALYDLIFSDLPTNDEKSQLIKLGGSDISCKKKDNRHWIPFFKRLRQRQNELPSGIRHTLNWYKRAHGW
jgi:hypothetical protein